MTKNKNHFTKLLFLIVFVFWVKCSYSKFIPSETDSHSLDFEQMKLDLFTQSRHKKLSEKIQMKNRKCLSDLVEVENGLNKGEEWALRSKINWINVLLSVIWWKIFVFLIKCKTVLDAWRKFPSAVMEGNLNDFGRFPECFHIKRNDKPYNSKYCVGQIVITPILQPKSDTNDFENSLNILYTSTLANIISRLHTIR